MTKEDILAAVGPTELSLALPNQFVSEFKKAATESNIEVLTQERYNKDLVFFKLKMPNTYCLFQSGVFMQINRTIPPGFQGDIDDIFKTQQQ